jgi:microcompartment protein CcmL/EutN
LGDGLGGKGLALFTGAVHDVQAAMEIGVSRVRDRQTWIQQTVIPILHEDVARKVAESTRFRAKEREV